MRQTNRVDTHPNQGCVSAEALAADRGGPPLGHQDHPGQMQWPETPGRALLNMSRCPPISSSECRKQDRTNTGISKIRIYFLQFSDLR